MSTSERRNKIIKILCQRRYESIQNLSQEFNVSNRTILRDIIDISNYAPIYTKSGRYEGGVYMMEGYYDDKLYLEDNEIDVLIKINNVIDFNLITNQEKQILSNIILKYKKPTIKRSAT